MQRGDEYDLVSVCKSILSFALEFPICVIYKNKDSWTAATSSFPNVPRTAHVHSAVFHKQFYTLLEKIVA
jgi:hypothetical protein